MIEVRASIQKVLFRDGTFGLKYAREKLSVTLLKGRSSVVRSSNNIGETRPASILRRYFCCGMKTKE
jgi:hypothetical protein